MQLYKTGFDDLGADRLKRWLNEAYHEVNEAEDWPYLETIASGASPVTTTDLRKLLSVTDTTNASILPVVARRWLMRVFASITTVATPAEYAWYDNTTTQIKTYPVPAAPPTVSVQYVKIPVDLAATTDTPVLPTRYHDLIVSGAIRRAYEARGDYQSAQAIDTEVQKGIAQMRTALLRPTPGREVRAIPTPTPSEVAE